MASILQVEELRGATSGANANKIIIPSGQTLKVDGSADGLLTEMPVGSVVQVQQYYNPEAGSEATTSTSFIASSITKTIVPKFSNSLIIVQANASMADGQAGWVAAKIFVNGASMPNSGSTTYHMGYQDMNHNRYSPMSFQGNYTCTSTNPLTFTVYYRSNGSSARITHPTSSSALTLWEIKQ